MTVVHQEGTGEDEGRDAAPHFAPHFDVLGTRDWGTRLLSNASLERVNRGVRPSQTSQSVEVKRGNNLFFSNRSVLVFEFFMHCLTHNTTTLPTSQQFRSPGPRISLFHSPTSS
jgi:hypothetical protein